MVFGLSVTQAERSSVRPPFHEASGSLVLCFGAAESSQKGPSASRRHLLSAHDHGRLRSSLVAAALVDLALTQA